MQPRRNVCALSALLVTIHWGFEAKEDEQGRLWLELYRGKSKKFPSGWERMGELRLNSQGDGFARASALRKRLFGETGSKVIAALHTWLEGEQWRTSPLKQGGTQS